VTSLGGKGRQVLNSTSYLEGPTAAATASGAALAPYVGGSQDGVQDAGGAPPPPRGDHLEVYTQLGQQQLVLPAVRGTGVHMYEPRPLAPMEYTSQAPALPPSFSFSQASDQQGCATAGVASGSPGVDGETTSTEAGELSEVVDVQVFLSFLGAERQAVCDYRASSLLAPPGLNLTLNLARMPDVLPQLLQPGINAGGCTR
jgi:hypothetical protein